MEILISGLPLAWIHVNAVVICSLDPLLTPKEEVFTGEVNGRSGSLEQMLNCCRLSDEPQPDQPKTGPH